MKTKFFYLLPFLVFVACNSVEPNNSSQKNNNFKYNVLFNGDSPYLNWYFSNMEAFILFSYMDYPNNTKGELYERVRGTEDNTITLNDDIKVKLHDDYELYNDEGKTNLKLTRTASLLNEEKKAPSYAKSNDDPTSNSETFDFSIHQATPIYIIRPEVDNCNPIPLCYYENFEIEWNGDSNNGNGVIIISEWNGVTIQNASEQISIANVDLVEDTGIAILNTDLFEGMPDEALVNLWLIRGDLITISTGDGEMTLQDALENSPEEFAESLATNPELYLQLQPFMFGSGAVATFSFFLIREL